jgi:hypothetical protein
VRLPVVHWLNAGTSATRVGVAPLGRGKAGDVGTYQAAMIPITSVFGAPEEFWYSLWSLITWPALMGMPSLGHSPPAG